MNVSVIDGIAIAFCGSALLLSVYLGYQDIAMSIAVGIIGYLGGSTAEKAKNTTKDSGEQK